ncbi:MAG TPA: galactose mutarotase [Sporosarcina psychrophila]|uniref:Aldose 1-epimerase n=1 Tax=Sporosarcina psychrophila TaxID=1476 RepID=A0A921G2W1_SPOPS|nr:galactose mutarotase [Sporosarcina psychrophila]
MKIEIQDILSKWKLYTLVNDNGMKVSFLDFGGIITNISVPDQTNTIENVVLGFKNYADYEKNSNYFGAIIGRVAGRIQDASFTIQNQTFLLEANEGDHHLHGGSGGFHQVIWRASPFQTDDTAGVKLTHKSLGGEGGYPGTIEVAVTYTLTNSNKLILDYDGKSDETTVLTMTNHSYFNLSGNLAATIHNHHVTMESNEFVELDTRLIPTGNKINVSNTPFDFRTERKLGDGINSISAQNKVANSGYDHYFIFNQNKQQSIRVKEVTSGRVMKIKTTQPGVVMYTANTLVEGLDLSEGKSRPYLGVCFETQAFPASLHHAGFPPVILKAHELYEKQTVFSFGIER